MILFLRYRSSNDIGEEADQMWILFAFQSEEKSNILTS
jgi:hypothetical protein